MKYVILIKENQAIWLHKVFDEVMIFDDKAEAQKIANMLQVKYEVIGI